MDILAISIGAVLGANARYFVGNWVVARLGAGFPYGTLLINVTGSFLIGFALVTLTQRAIGPTWIRPAIVIGLLGTYTTFSTFSYETLSLINAGNLPAAGANIAASVGAGLVAVYLGTMAAAAI